MVEIEELTIPILMRNPLKMRKYRNLFAPIMNPKFLYFFLNKLMFLVLSPLYYSFIPVYLLNPLLLSLLLNSPFSIDSDILSLSS